jgi:fluoroquinolone transport system permease protein
MPKRFLSTLLWDIRLQYRNGFYFVSAFVAAVFIVLLRRLTGVDWAQLWPVILLENLVVNSFYFMAGLVLLENEEGTIEAQVVTPLRQGEYLASKVLSLTILSVFESLVSVVAVTGPRFNWLLLAGGILVLIAFYGLYGFLVVSRYDSITDFLLPSAVWVMWFSLPLLYFFDIWRSWVMFLHPLQAPLVLLQAAFEPVPAWQVLYGFGYGLAWVVLTGYLARRAFHRFVVTKQGARRRTTKKTSQPANQLTRP